MAHSTATYRKQDWAEPAGLPKRTLFIAEGLAEVSRKFRCRVYEQADYDNPQLEYPKDHPLEVQKLVHMGGSDLGSSRWSIAHSIAGKATVLFTLEIAGGEIFMYQGADLRRAISSMPNTERGSSSRTFVYDGACFTWRRRRSLTSGWFVLVEGRYSHSDDDDDAPMREVIAEYRPHKLRHGTVEIYRDNAVPLPLIVLTAMAVEQNKMDFGWA